MDILGEHINIPRGKDNGRFGFTETRDIIWGKVYDGSGPTEGSQSIFQDLLVDVQHDQIEIPTRNGQHERTHCRFGSYRTKEQISDFQF